MKITKLVFVLLFIFNISSVFSQNVKIYGNIDDTEYEDIILSPGIYSLIIDSKKNLYPRNGYFEFNVSIDGPSIYYLYYKKKRINVYVEPDKEVQLAIDNRKTEDFVIFYGDLAAENGFYNREDRPSVGNKNQRDSLKIYADKGVSPYLKYLESEIKQQKMYFNIAEEKLPLSASFKEMYIANEIDLAGMLFAAYYPSVASLKVDSFIVNTPKFLNIFNAIDPNIDYSNIPKYYSTQLLFLKDKAYLHFEDKVKANALIEIDAYKYMYQEAKDYKPKERRILEDKIIGEWISYYGEPTAMKEEISEFVETEPSETVKEAIKKKLVYLSLYEKGNPAPIFTFTDDSENKRNLKEFVGKIVYIDVWASWCAPCIKEIPFSKKLYEKYKDNPDIVFIYLSIDESKDDWQAALIKYQLDEGVQGIAFPGGFNSDFAKKYNIQSIPSYILIDKSSNIVDMKAPHPSEENEINELFEKLMQ